MGQRLTDRRGRRAWSRLSQSQGVRNGVRILVFAGAVGATWFLSSAANAHPEGDPEFEAQPPSAEAGVERPVEDDTALDRLLTPLCQDVPKENLEPQKNPEQATQDPADDTTRPGLLDLPLLPAESVTTCEATDTLTAQSGEATPHHDISPAPNFPFAPSPVVGQQRETTGATEADPDSVTGALGFLTGEVDPLLGPLAPPVRSIIDTTTTTVPSVDHTGRWLTRTVAHSLLDVTQPLFVTAEPIVRPAVDTLAGVTGPVTDKVTGAVLPGLDDAVGSLGSFPVADTPATATPVPPTLPTSPVAPGADRFVRTTTTFAPAAEVPSGTARGTGSATAASVPPLRPAPVPLPVGPGSDAIMATATASYAPHQGGGLAATVPASLDPNAPELSALSSTRNAFPLRQFANEPAVSPD